MTTDKFPVDGLPNGYICESGNLLSGTTGQKVISQTGCEFWTPATLPYAYEPDPVSAVEAEVKRFAGSGPDPVALSPGFLQKTGSPTRVHRRNGRLLYLAGRAFPR